MSVNERKKRNKKHQQHIISRNSDAMNVFYTYTVYTMYKISNQLTFYNRTITDP